MQRRKVLKAVAWSVGARALPPNALEGEPQSHVYTGPVIDAHIHLFDPSRPGGVPWPEKTDAVLYKPALPERYAAQSAQFGVVGAIAIEASPLLADNRWLLDIARANPLIVGVVGDLVPGSEGFAGELERLHGDPLFLGIRYGNLWNRDLAADLENAGFVDGLKTLAAAGLVFESANPDARLIHALVQVAERVPALRIVVDHLPHAPIPVDATDRRRFWAGLRLLAASPRVFVKLSEIPERVNGKLHTDIRANDEHLDALWELFGEDHVLFGSDWPNSDHVANYAETFSIVCGYLARKGPGAQQKFFWQNSMAAYKWQRRLATQPALQTAPAASPV